MQVAGAEAAAGVWPPALASLGQRGAQNLHVSGAVAAQCRCFVALSHSLLKRHHKEHSGDLKLEQELKMKGIQCRGADVLRHAER